MVELRLPATTSLHRLLLSNKDALVCLFDQGIVSVAGFATSVLIGRWAGKAELGLYIIGLSMVLFARGFQQQLVSTPYTIYHHRRSESLMPAYRGSCMVLQAGFLAITLAYLLIQILAAQAGWISAEVVPSLIVLLIFIPAILMRELVRNFCFVHSRNTSVLKIDIAISALQVAALFGLGFFNLLSGATAWIAIGGACLLTVVYWYYRSGPVLQFAKEPLVKDTKLNWTFAKWAVSGQFVGSLPTYLLPWLLLLAAGAEGAGMLGAGMALVGIANIFNTGILNFLTPKAAKVYVDEGNTGLRRLMVQMYLVFLVAIGSFIAMLTVFGDWVTFSVFGSDYEGLQIILILLAVAKLFEGFSHTASGGLFAMERIRENFYIDVILMVVTITAALLLIGPYGVLGAAWTTLISASTSAILRSGLLMTFLSSSSTAGGSDD